MLTGVDHVNDKFKVNGTKLYLPKISYQLDGIDFQCSAQNPIGLSEPETIKLNVLYQPRLTDMSPLNHKVALGDELRLECQFSGNPKPTIRWNFVDSIYSQEHSPEATLENPGMLIIKNVSYTDEGTFAAFEDEKRPKIQILSFQVTTTVREPMRIQFRIS